ncbi:hypothetical protein B0X71_03815 [Planococcus lenghuensis]|uniref:Uncharacterized protein n=1 Tax=Planococcus lenghuensis TaxID=2213202 RepID=A0A1Q2KVU4_9BACL|nr:hypothetical protein B0X71_03815 [Planococcus lenghuensis]
MGEAAFLLQSALLGLFLGPLTDLRFFLPFYTISFLALAIFVLAFRRLEKRKWLPAIFIAVSGVFLLYMVLLNSLWGKDVSFIY